MMILAAVSGRIGDIILATIPLAFHLVCLICLQPNETTLSEFAFVDDMIQFYKQVKPRNNCRNCFYRLLRVSELRTGGEHALYEIVDITKDNSETFWTTLLAGQRLDLNALQDRLRDGLIWFIGVEYRTVTKGEYITRALDDDKSWALTQGSLDLHVRLH